MNEQDLDSLSDEELIELKKSLEVQTKISDIVKPETKKKDDSALMRGLQFNQDRAKDIVEAVTPVGQTIWNNGGEQLANWALENPKTAAGIAVGGGALLSGKNPLTLAGEMAKKTSEAYRGIDPNAAKALLTPSMPPPPPAPPFSPPPAPPFSSSI